MIFTENEENVLYNFVCVHEFFSILLPGQHAYGASKPKKQSPGCSEHVKHQCVLGKHALSDLLELVYI